MLNIRTKTHNNQLPFSPLPPNQHTNLCATVGSHCVCVTTTGSAFICGGGYLHCYRSQVNLIVVLHRL